MRCPICDHDLQIKSHIKKYKTPELWVAKYGDPEITTLEIRVIECPNEECSYICIEQHRNGLMCMFDTGRGMYISTLPALIYA